MGYSTCCIAVFFCCFSCTGNVSDDRQPDDVTAPPVWTCGTTDSAIPRQLDLPAPANNGVFDFSLESDPDNNRLWASFSGVQGPAGTGYISTLLGFSDDGGATWCSTDPVNAAVEVNEADLPAGLVGLPAHWNHEVSTLVRDPSAPAEERWKLVWHRYLEAIDPDPAVEPRRFQYGWMAMKAAPTPEGLLHATERTLFAAAPYSLPGIIDYNQAVSTPPEVDWTGTDVADCVVFTEPGAHATATHLYLTFTCVLPDLERRVVLVERDAAGVWRFVANLVTQASAQAVMDSTGPPGAVTLGGASASAIFDTSEGPILSVTPVAPEYRGCWFFPLTLETGELGNGGIPTRVLPHAAGSFLSGMCDWDMAATQTGIVFGEVHETVEQFRLFATGQVF